MIEKFKVMILVNLVVINIIAFILYGIDKYKAKRAKWRIPERTLLLFAVMGGSIGALMGIYIWHHKTFHKKFYLGVPAIIILQIILLVYLRFN